MTKKKPAAEQTATETTAVEAAENPKPKTKGRKKAKARTAARPRAKKPTAMPKARAAENLVVFAFRLTAEERDVIHDAAGPAKASRFVRAVALAAARRDVQALQSILLETQAAAAS
jgi:hypothetical protein